MLRKTSAICGVVVYGWKEWRGAGGSPHGVGKVLGGGGGGVPIVHVAGGRG